MLDPSWQKNWTEEEFSRIQERFKSENPGEKCTCDGCCDKKICSCAYDFYNTQGDCLYGK